MKIKKLFLFFVPVFFVCFFAQSQNVLAQTAKYRLQPTDVLTITVNGQPNLDTKTRVTSDGFITFPLVGKVGVEGVTVQELEDKLKRLLEKDYLVTAQVVVFIEDYHPRQVSVLGEVNKPGKYDMPEENDMTFLEAIALAGGFTKDAYLKKVKIMRTQNGEKQIMIIDVRDITIKNEKEKDIKILPEDIIIVPESFF